LNLGTPYYIEAKNLANMGSLSKYQRGWSTRIQELDKITDIRTRPLREAKPDFFEAKYLLEEGKIQEAKVYALKVLDNIEKVVSQQPNNKYLRTFFDAHHRTFALIFADNEEALSRLVDYDSYHRETYREIMP
jgi:soluble cytochrome b562